MTTATAAAPASTANATTTGGIDKQKPYSGRPNPINIAYEKKMEELDKRITDAKSRLVS
jgi:hypothetical protein